MGPPWNIHSVKPLPWDYSGISARPARPPGTTNANQALVCLLGSTPRARHVPKKSGDCPSASLAGGFQAGSGEWADVGGGRQEGAARPGAPRRRARRSPRRPPLCRPPHITAQRPLSTLVLDPPVPNAV